MSVRIQLCFTLGCLAALTACGTPGAPMPPSLELPRPVEDLTASRKGNQVTLTWTPPTRTTDAQNVRFKKLGPVSVCRGVNEFPMARCNPLVGQISPAPLPAAEKGKRKLPPAPRISYTDTLPADLQQMYPTGTVTYAVETMNWRWRSAGLSNQVRLPLAPALNPPSSVDIGISREGPVIGFKCSGAVPVANPALHYECRLYREEVCTAPPAKGQPPCSGAAAIASVPYNQCSQGSSTECRVVDHGFEWEKTYRYWVAAVTDVTENGRKTGEIEGADSEHSTPFLVHDTFPPAVPADLEAVTSGVGQKPFIDLTWTPGTDPDLAGYNVYRQDDANGPWTKINPDLVAMPAFRDENVSPGHSYAYRVTAVDARQNESDRSRIARERVP